MNKKLTEELSILEAVDYLSNMAELDIPKGKEEQILKEHQIRWLDAQLADKNREIVKETFRVVHNYLKHVYEKDQGKLKDPDTQRGIQAMMVLADEAAQKVNKCTDLFQDSREIKEFKDLQYFYLNKIVKRFQTSLESEEAWQQHWLSLEEEALTIQTKGLRDLETVRRDKEYELFFIRKEDGKPFFNRNLLRHIKLVGDFDETISDPEGDDPFLNIQVLHDRDLNLSAQEIMTNAEGSIRDFYKLAANAKEKEIVLLLNEALMALMLAGNPRNLIQNAMGKSSVSYFRDFQYYLRRALKTNEYADIISTAPEEREPFSEAVMELADDLAEAMYERNVNRIEALKLIHQLIQKGEKLTGSILKEGTGIAQWSTLLDQDEQIRYILKRYPSGPLMKTLDVLRDGESREGYSPLMQNNIPFHLFNFEIEGVSINCLRLPSPTFQDHINKAEVDKEFEAYLRALATKSKKNIHLMFNLQDRTSWQEHARCQVLEGMHRQAEFSADLVVVTIPKNTDFYLQSEYYLNLNEAEQFMQQLKEQVSSGEACGFYFPPHLKKDQIDKFTDEAIELIYKHFFEKKKHLARSERLEFIEIFYQLLVLKIIDWVEPSHLSFTCKDAVDTGIAQSAAFYSFLRLIGDSSDWSKEEKNFLLWMLYAPALLIRERAIDAQRLNRIVSMLAHVHAVVEENRKILVQGLLKLYRLSFFKNQSIKINY